MSFLAKNNFLPIFKKVGKNQKDNYRVLNILPILFKIFEKVLNKQLPSYFKYVFTKFQCHFR